MEQIISHALEGFSAASVGLISGMIISLAVWISRVVTRPIKQLAKSIQQIAPLQQELDEIKDDVRGLVEASNTRTKQNCRQDDGLQALLHGQIYYLSKAALERQCISEEELDNLEHYYKPYVEGGGNGIAKTYIEACRRLPLRKECDG